MMSSREWMRLKARTQRVLGWITTLFFSASLLFLITRGWGFRFEKLKDTRALYKSLVKAGRPLLICANHLTYLDPVLLHYYLGRHPWYFFNYKFFAWNLAAAEYATNPVFGPICYLSKVLFIQRKARPKYLDDLFGVVSEFLQNRETVSIFPEGRRSRTGRFDDRKLAHGIGEILSRVDSDVTVLCIYLRGLDGSGFGSFPKRKTRFSILTHPLHLEKVGSSKESKADATYKIARQIQALEEKFFSEHGIVVENKSAGHNPQPAPSLEA